MKSYLISDNQETLIGMRLAGIEGVIAHTKEEILEEFKKLLEHRDIGIVIITEKILSMAEEEIMKVKLERDYPLITVIPNRDPQKREDYISKYIKESIGIKI
ncbi:V-type ATP synthase subunit F [Paramaledivibacter caminithermalis]|jgi:V/A-type H+-transporting ATPase subunit F|uniref:V/A-type H+-transporting ATPase subunit F n=1 Tax=Paramaledivibacter caminithermalis (strain DSM 15212 / CIP 107654 / DViRD3) TaxID=1121301 RepID=A0A1M6L166_PARC5|nr:V-type ATP synthase subunit F [Paramaledivibacter caminithermalis]SHJ64903.1 V/A-type H+-transporting ATPase subunit F [Paramaledivibacter caminithermalis DSM 15212]